MTYAPPARARWIPSHYRRYPARPETFNRVHAELMAAWCRDEIRRQQLQKLEDDPIEAVDTYFAGIGLDGRELAG